MKRVLFVITFIIAGLTCFAQSFQYTYQGQTLNYTIIDLDSKTCMTSPGRSYNNEVTPGNDISGDLIIPEKAKFGNDEYSVVKIGSYSFYYCDNLQSVTIPNTITNINHYAFEFCHNLKSFAVNNCETRQTYAHETENGRILTSTKNTNQDYLIDEGAFSYCYNLVTVRIPDAITSIGDYSFSSCLKLQNIKLPRNLVSIGRNAFQNCQSLTSIEIPNSVSIIGDSAFWFCKSLKSHVSIPDAVTTIGDCTFAGCGFTSVTLGTQVSTISASAFYECDALTTLRFKNIVPPKVIEDNVFNSNLCNEYTIVYVPSTSLNEYKNKLSQIRHFVGFEDRKSLSFNLLQTGDFINHIHDLP